jgi:hypothetical protein
MALPDPLYDAASALAEAANGFHGAAEAQESHRAAPDSLAALEEALQALSAAWYRLAADAVPRGVQRTGAEASDAAPRRSDLSREQEVSLIGALHDIAAAFARCARICREGGSTITPILATRASAAPSSAAPISAGPLWFAGRRPTTERVARLASTSSLPEAREQR